MEEFKVVDADSFPESVARPETPPNPNIVTAKDGVGVKYPGCDGMGNRIVHPDNPKAPSKNFGVVMFYVPPHVKLDTGAHPNEECYVIQRGSGVMTLNGEQVEVSAGMFIHLPSWCQHGIENTGDEALEILICTSPPNP